MLAGLISEAWALPLVALYSCSLGTEKFVADN
jgi:hypothetical protein